MTGKPGSTVQLLDQNNNPIGTPTILDDKGQGSITLPANTSGQQIGVAIKDGTTQSPATNVEVPLLAPQLGVVNPETGALPVTGKPGSTVQLLDQNKNPIGTPTILDDKGQGSITLPANTSGQQIGVAIKDGTTQSSATNVEVPLLAPQLGVVNPETGALPVTGKPGSTVQLLDPNKNPIGAPTTLDDKGQGSITLPANTSGQQIGVAIKDGTTQSPATNVEVPLLAPQLGVVNPETGALPVTGKPGSTVQLLDPNKNPIGAPTTLDDKGQGSVTLPANTSGQQIGVAIKDGTTQSPATNVEVPLLAPQLGAVNPETGALPVTGKPGSTVQLLDPNNNPVGTPTTLDDKGQGSITLPANTSGDQVGVVIKDGTTQSPATSVEVPLLAPQLGAVDTPTGQLPVTGKPGSTTQLQDPSSNLTGRPTSDEGRDVVDPATGNVLVTGKPGSTVQLQDQSGNPIGKPVKLDDQGHGTVTLPGNTSGQQVGVLIKDGDKESPVTNVKVPLLAPQLGAVDAVTGQLLVTGKPGSVVQLLDQDGNPIGNSTTLDDKGQGTLVLPPSVSEEQIGVVIKDGNTQSPVTRVEVPLLAPQMGPVDSATSQLPVNGKPGATVQLQDSSGKAIGMPVTLDNAGKGALTLPVDTSGDSLKAVQTSGTTTSPASDAVSIPVLKPIVGAIDPQTGSLIVEGKPGATVQLKDSTGASVGTPVTLGNDGKGILQIPTTLSDQAVTVTQTFNNSESPATVPLTVPLLKPLLDTPDAATGTVAVTGKPGASVQLQDSTGKTVGTPVILDNAGKGVLTLLVDSSGDNLQAVQTSGATTSPASDAVSIPVLKPIVGTVDPQTDILDVVGEPGATVQLKDVAGNPVGTPVILDSAGKGVLQVPVTQSDKPVVVTQTVNNVESLPSAQISVPLLKPSLDTPSAATGTVAVTGKPGATVQLQDSTGKAVGTPVILDNAGKGVLTLPVDTSGDSLKAVQTSGTTTSAASDAVSIPLLKPVVGTVDPQTGTLDVVGEPGATVQLKDAAGTPVGTPVILDSAGKGVLQVPVTQSDKPVVVTQTVNNVESLPTAQISVPLLKPSLDTPNAATSTVAVTGKPGATV
ncbi:hypothetical protein, partial [Pseudomonas sp. L13]|uniref:hypothetical protein n=1 Tax=Pseudomonas sp. L13 TaxID=343985 RepID=UPI0021143332